MPLPMYGELLQDSHSGAARPLNGLWLRETRKAAEHQLSQPRAAHVFFDSPPGVTQHACHGPSALRRYQR